MGNAAENKWMTYVEGLGQLVAPRSHVGKKYSEEEYVFIKIDDYEIGPLWNQDLKAFISQCPDFPMDSKIREFASDSWVEIYGHPFYQRRRPQIVQDNDGPKTTQEKEERKYFILLNGSKKGPLSSNEISQMIDDQELTINDLISSTEQDKWIKIYQLGEFDRRKRTNSELPSNVDTEIVENFSDTTATEESLGEKTDAMVQLAFIEKKIAKENKEKRFSTLSGVEGLSDKYKYATLALLVIGVIAIFYKGTELESIHSPKKAKKTKIKEPEIIKRKKVVNKKSEINNKKVDIKKPSPKKDSRIGESRKPVDQEFYFPDNESTPPVEQDKLRSKISKETLYPEDELEEDYEYDEYQRSPQARPRKKKSRRPAAEEREEAFAELFDEEIEESPEDYQEEELEDSEEEFYQE